MKTYLRRYTAATLLLSTGFSTRCQSRRGSPRWLIVILFLIADLLCACSLYAQSTLQGKIVFISNRDEFPCNSAIFIMNPDGTDQTRLSCGFNGPPFLSRDGQRITFSANSNMGDHIYVMNADGTGKTQLTFPPGEDTEANLTPQFSPDGTRIVFASGRTRDAEIWVMNANGSGPTQLTRREVPLPGNSPGRGEPSFSPDGRQIVYMQNRVDSGIYVMNADGSNPKRVVSSPSHLDDLRHPTFSPDGSRIIFVNPNTPNGVPRIEWIDASGSPPQILIEQAQGAFKPSFSPDGTQIVFSGHGAFSAGTDGKLYVAKSDGSEITPLSNVPLARVPHWGGGGATPTPTPTPTPSPPPPTPPPPTPPPPTPPPPTPPPPTPSQKPVITSVTRQYPGVFLQGTEVDNKFDVTVVWNGEPGTVRFEVEGSFSIQEPGTGAGASHTFNMGRDFTPSFTPFEMRIIARNAAGQESNPKVERICLLPYPAWLDIASKEGKPVQYEITGGDVKIKFKDDFPKPHLAKEGPIQIPEDIPFIGGKFGVTETFARLEGQVSTNSGKGSTTLSGQTGFTAADQTLTGKVSGKGDVLLECEDGLQLDSTTFVLNLTGNISKEVGVADVIPQLIVLQRVPVIGKAIKWFSKKATLTGELEPSMEFTAVFRQNPLGLLEFDDTTGALGYTLKATLAAKVSKDRLTASGWVAGGGGSTVGVPKDPFLREVKVTFEAGIEFKLDAFIKKDWKGTAAFDCTWKPETGTVCGRTKQEEGAAASFSLVEPNEQFGQYAEFVGHNDATESAAGGKGDQRSGKAAVVSDGTIVSNVFAGAAPTTVELPNGEQLLLWTHADPALPLTRAMGIMWSVRDAQGSWSEPQLIAADTRAEFSPVAGLDGSGKVVAAWLRVKDSDFPETIATEEEVVQFYKNFEVITANFDPASRSWSDLTQLTEDAALDTDLQLSSDGAGGLLLSWLSNPEAEMISSAASPSTLKYSLRAGGSWTSPGVVAGLLVGVNGHAAAVRGQQGFIVLSRDPDEEAGNDGVLELYRLSGGGWTGAETFAAAGVENRLPVAAYDSTGTGHVAWVHGDSLVSATLADPTPRLVRTESTGLGFYDAQLVANKAGHLALIYQEPGEEGASDLFASIFDPTAKVWSEPQKLIVDPRQSADASAYFDAQGNLRLAYLATEILRVTRVVTINGAAQSVPNVPAEGATDLRVSILSGPALTPPRFANISTRMRVETGDNVLIAGFIITGSQPKRVIVRGIGPSLPVDGALADPTLDLDGGTFFNDNWKSDQEQEIRDTTIPPSSDLESAIVATLQPGAHTAVLRGVNDGTGVGLVEVYDLESGSPVQLANISTRGQVQTGNNVMIGGFIIAGDYPAKVLLRAIGPSLSSAGVSGALQDPTLELVDANGNSTFNDNWRESQETEIVATTVPPANDQEAAIVATLVPGAYTAVVRGKDGTTGVALIEGYNLH